MNARADKETRGGATLDEVANELGVSRERARQIERNALRKLIKGARRRLSKTPADGYECVMAYRHR